jgi:hypothetical protein
MKYFLTLKTNLMQPNYLATPLKNEPDDADPSINIHELIYPEVETNTEEGDEYLDDEIRIKDQPDEGKK